MLSLVLRRRGAALALLMALVAAIAAVIVVASPGRAAPPDASHQADLDAARARWEDAGPASYTLEYRLLCLCVNGPFTVEVAAGAIVSATDAQGDPIDPGLAATYDVPALFEAVQEAIDAPVDDLVVDYDVDLGYPARIAMDRIAEAVDDELTIEVLALRTGGGEVTLFDQVDLVAGWNLVAWTGNADVVAATAAISESFDVLFVWDAEAQQYLSYAPALSPALNTLDELGFGDGVWIHVTNSAGVAWDVPAFGSPRSAPLAAGFNLVAWTGPDGLGVVEATAALGGALTALYTWDADAQEFRAYRPGGPSIANTAATLRHGHGVWMEMSAPATWEQPAVAAPAPGHMAALGEAVRLGVGESVAVDGTILTLTFDGVTGDNRCPIDVTCIVAGEAQTQFTASLDGAAEPLTIVVPAGGSGTGVVGAFVVTVEQVLPEPVSTESIDPGAYMVDVRVDADPASDQLRLAPIDSVEIVVAESFPEQYFAQITSGLPDGCTEHDHITTDRSGTTVTVRVWNRVPAADLDLVCTLEYRTVDHNVALGSDFTDGVEYTVDVNGEIVTFVAQ